MILQREELLNMKTLTKLLLITITINYQAAGDKVA